MKKTNDTASRIGHVENNPALIRDVNRLWERVYPGLARQVAECCRTAPRTILEAGCFSGGTGLELLKLFPEARLSVAGEMKELVDSFTDDWPALHDPTIADRVQVLHTGLDAMAVPDDSQDLVFCRGVFFFLDETGTILKELFRVLAPGGTTVAGGGFGAHTPTEVISEIADASREKNRRLGRTIVAVEDFKNCLDRIGPGASASVMQEGGLWAVLRKQP